MIKIILKSLIITTIMNSSIICIDPLTYFSNKSILHTPHYTYRNILCGNIRKYLPPRFQTVSQLGHPIYTCVIPTPPHEDTQLTSYVYKSAQKKSRRRLLTLAYRRRRRRSIARRIIYRMARARSWKCKYWPSKGERESLARSPLSADSREISLPLSVSFFFLMLSVT